MRRGWIVLSGWGVLLLAHVLVQLVFEPRFIEMALGLGFSTVMVLLGLVALTGERREWAPRPDGDGDRLLTWSSAAAAAVGAGLALLALGWEVGPWLVGIGAGVIVLGAGGLVREHRAERRA